MQDTAYDYVIVESYRHKGGGTKHAIGARVVAGQGHSTSMRVECAAKMRTSHPVGTKFRIRAKLTDKEGGTPFLYSNFNWKYTVVGDEEAAAIIAAKSARK